MALSDEARAAIKDAVDIVREDRMEKFLRSRFAKKDDDRGDGKDGKTPPNRPSSEPPTRKGAWWGEFDSGDRS